MYINKIIKYKSEVKKNLSFDYTQFINKDLIQKINFKITITQKQLVKYCHQILFVFFPIWAIFFACGLIMYAIGFNYVLTPNVNSTWWIIWGVGQALVIITVISFIYTGVKVIIYLRKNFFLLFNQFMHAVDVGIIFKDYQNYPSLLKMCFYSHLSSQWRLDYPNSPFNMFTPYLCCQCLIVFFTQANKLKAKMSCNN